MKILTLVFLCFIPVCLCAQTYSVYGRVTDKESGETLIGVHIYSEDTEGGVRSGCASNAYGFYSIALEKGENVIVSSMIGYITSIDTLFIEKDMKMNLELKRENIRLEDVVVAAPSGKEGHTLLTPDKITAVPAIGGEPDLLKGLLFQPGVTSGNDGGNNLSVRGGNHWQNLYLLDEATIYNPNHALSFYSVFNMDATRQVDFYKSYIPPRFGGRLSSIVDVKMKDGNSKDYHFKGSVGLLSSKILAEGPIVKEKASFMIAGRYGYPGLLAKGLGALPFGNFYELKNTDIRFYDLNAKVNVFLNPGNRLFASFYTSGDHFYSDLMITDYVMNWNNTTATLRWNSIWNAKLNANTLFYFSNYKYDYTQFTDGRNYVWRSDMQSYSLQHKIDYYYSDRLKINAGLTGDYLVTRPGEIDRLNGTSNINPYRLERRQNLTVAAFAEGMYNWRERWFVNAGIRLNANYAFATSVLSDSWIVSPEPRLELRYKPRKNSSVWLTANYLTQQMHLLSNSSMGLPSDIWIPSNARLKPASAFQFSLGYEKSFAENMYTASVEGYYKNMRNVPDYKDNVDIFMNNEPENIVEMGQAYSTGVEFSLIKEKGKLTGWVNYTLSRTRNKINGINNNQAYAPVYDRPHNLKAVLSYRLSDRWSLSSTFALRSGMNVTIPVGYYQFQGVTFYEYGERNGYRAPLYHQLDVQLAYKPYSKGRWQSEWSFGVMNLYNRKNVFSLFAGRDEFAMTKFGTYKMYLYGMLPSVTYTIKF